MNFGAPNFTHKIGRSRYTPSKMNGLVHLRIPPAPWKSGTSFFQTTLLETNIAPENTPSQKEIDTSSNHPFSGAMLVSGRVSFSGCPAVNLWGMYTWCFAPFITMPSSVPSFPGTPGISLNCKVARPEIDASARGFPPRYSWR